MKGMAAFGDDVRLFAWKTKAEAEGLETDGALCVVVDGDPDGDNGDGVGGH